MFQSGKQDRPKTVPKLRKQWPDRCIKEYASGSCLLAELHPLSKNNDRILLMHLVGINKNVDLDRRHFIPFLF